MYQQCVYLDNLRRSLVPDAFIRAYYSQLEEKDFEGSQAMDTILRRRDIYMRSKSSGSGYLFVNKEITKALHGENLNMLDADTIKVVYILNNDTVSSEKEVKRFVRMKRKDVGIVDIKLSQNERRIFVEVHDSRKQKSRTATASSANILPVELLHGIITFLITNNSPDTLFLFDSYLNEELYGSRYLHRYDKKAKRCKLSFLPLLPYLSPRYRDVVILGGEKIANKGQIIFHFKAIPPNETYAVSIPKDFFHSREYVDEVYPQKYSKFDRRIKFRSRKRNRCDDVLVEFAIYKSVDLLKSENAYYFDELAFNEQALSYDILSITIEPNMQYSPHSTCDDFK
jgi:hypothetical protein